jgi:hypothetical protein
MKYVDRKRINTRNGYIESEHHGNHMLEAVGDIWQPILVIAIVVLIFVRHFV